MMAGATFERSTAKVLRCDQGRVISSAMSSAPFSLATSATAGSQSAGGMMVSGGALHRLDQDGREAARGFSLQLVRTKSTHRSPHVDGSA